MWSCAASQEQHVRLWLPTLYKAGWPAVRQALLQGSTTKIQDLTPEQVTIALAAAIIVAAARGKPDPEMPASTAKWVEQNQSSLTPDLIHLALSVIDRAEAYFSPDWAESDEEFGYQTAANELRRALGQTHEHLMRDPPGVMSNPPRGNKPCSSYS